MVGRRVHKFADSGKLVLERIREPIANVERYEFGSNRNGLCSFAVRKYEPIEDAFWFCSKFGKSLCSTVVDNIDVVAGSS